jgi:hypothetical protein
MYRSPSRRHGDHGGLDVGRQARLGVVDPERHLHGAVRVRHVGDVPHVDAEHPDLDPREHLDGAGELGPVAVRLVAAAARGQAEQQQGGGERRTQASGERAHQRVPLPFEMKPSMKSR